MGGGGEAGTFSSGGTADGVGTVGLFIGPRGNRHR